MTPGQTRTVQATFAIPPSYSGAFVANTATVTAATADPSSPNNTSTLSTAVSPFAADLAIAKAGPAATTRGQDLTYTITVVNNGPDDAASVEVADPTPAGLDFVSSSGDCVTPFPCTLGLLAAGASRSITATFRVPSGYAGPARIENRASLSSATPDPNPANDSATAVTDLAGLAFYSVAPCRVIDTRDPAQAPALAAQQVRAFSVAGACGVPASALAVSVNLTVAQATHAGDLRVYPAGMSPPTASAINYGAGATRANNAVLSLGTGGALEILSDQTVGTVHFILDVNGFYQ
jgi:uncharacterized repeat protein (TIGR01451 family)